MGLIELSIPGHPPKYIPYISILLTNGRQPLMMMNNENNIIERYVKLNIRSHPFKNDELLFFYQNLLQFLHHLNPER